MNETARNGIETTAIDFNNNKQQQPKQSKRSSPWCTNRGFRRIVFPPWYVVVVVDNR
jgi:hypothetical protein